MVKQETHGSRRLTSVSGIKHAATDIQSSCRTLLDIETTAGNCGVKQGTESSISTALLCEKQWSDPEIKNHKSNIVRSSHVPTCEKPAMQRLGASLKAAGRANGQTQPLFDSG